MAEEQEYENKVKEIQKIQRQNLQKMQALAQSGHRVDPGSLANIKIDTFIQMLDKNSQAAYMLAMEKNFQAALDEGLSQVRQAQITEGITASGLKIPR